MGTRDGGGLGGREDAATIPGGWGRQHCQTEASFLLRKSVLPLKVSHPPKPSLQ